MVSATQPSSTRRRWFALAAVLLATAGSLGMAEIVARVAYQGPVVSGTVITNDPELAFVPRLDHEVRWKTSEFDVTISTDPDLGCRVARRGDKVPTAPALAFFGDSFVHGHGVTHEETFSSVLRARHPGLEIVNAGVYNYGPDQEFLWARRLRPALRPAREVACCFAGNDMEDFGRYRLLTVGPTGVTTHPAHDPSGMRRRRITALPVYPWLCGSYLFHWLKLVLIERPPGYRPGWTPNRASLSPAEEDRIARLALLYAIWQREVGRERFLVVIVPHCQLFDSADARTARLEAELTRLQVRFANLGDHRPRGSPEAFHRLFFRFDQHWNREGHSWAAGALESILAGAFPELRALLAASPPAR